MIYCDSSYFGQVGHWLPIAVAGLWAIAFSIVGILIYFNQRSALPRRLAQLQATNVVLMQALTSYSRSQTTLQQDKLQLEQRLAELSTQVLQIAKFLFLEAEPTQGQESQSLLHAVTTAINSGETLLREEIEIDLGDGKRKTFLNSAVPLRNENQEVIGAILVNQDITEQQLVEKAFWENQLLIQRIAEAMPAILYLHDLVEGRNIYSNHQISEILGYSPHEVQQMGSELMAVLLHPDDRETVFAAGKQLATVSDGTVVEVEYRMRHANGEWHWLHSRDIVFTRNGENLPQQIVGVAADITANKQREAQIQFQVSLLEQVRNAVIATDLEGNITYWNHFAETLYQWKAEEVLGKAIGELFLPIGEQELAAAAEVMSRLRYKRWEGEFTVRRKDGSTFPAYVVDSTIHNSQGQPIGYVAVSIDITAAKRSEQELKQYRDRLEELVVERTVALTKTNQQLQQEICDRIATETALQQSEYRFYTLAKVSPVGIFRTDVWGNCLYVNARWCKMTGLTSAEILAQNWVRAFHPEDQERVFAAWNQAVQENAPFQAESRLQQPDGTIVWVLAQVATERQDVADVSGDYVGTITDITERKQAEIAIAESAKRWQMIVETIGEGITLSDETGQFAVFNSHIQQITGYTQEQANHCPDFLALLYPDASAYRQARLQLQKTIRQEGCRNVETTICNAQGVQRTLLVSTSLMQSDNKLWFLSAYRDITLRNQVQEALWESEARYCSLTNDVLDNSAVGILILDAEFRIVWINTALESFFGWDREDVVGEDKRQLLRNRMEPLFASPEEFISKVLATYENNTEVANFECHVLQSENCTERWLEHWSQPIQSGLYAGGRIEQYTDITERKQAEVVLRESEERYRRLVEMSPEAIVVYCQGKYVYINAAGAQLLGAASSEELIGKPVLDLVHPEDRASIEARIQQTEEQEKPTPLRQFRLVRLDGKVRDVEAAGIPITYQGKPAGQAIVRDISDRKHAEALLAESEERYRVVSEQISDFAYALCIAPDGEVTVDWITDAFSRISGLTPQEVKQFNNWKKLIHPNDLPLVLQRMQRLFNGQPEVGDYRIITESGAVRWLRNYSRPVRCDLQNHCLLIYGAAQDITEKKQAEEAHQESEERFRKIFADAPIGIALGSPEGEIAHVNSALCQMLGYTEQEVIGHDFREFSFPEDLEAEELLIEQILHREISSYQIEKRFIKKNGDLFWSNLTCGSILDHNGNIIYGLEMVEDITERKHIERMKEEFISVVSHELRTPLTSLRGALGLMTSGRLGTLTKNGERLLNLAVADTERLVRLVNDILDVERLKSGKLALKLQAIPVTNLMQQGADIVQPLAENAGITLRVVPLTATVWADSDRIIQTLTNLLSNAIKFSPNGSTVSVSAKADGDRILFQVTDQGRGIPAEQLDSIFERFSQVDASDSRTYGGTGLGLAICRSIVQQHGGCIWVESTLQAGSTLTA
jgi:PAS domain S-box-containing protein